MDFHMGIGADAGAASSALGNLLSGLKQQAAANQKAQQQQLKDQFDQELKLREKGYTPFYTPGKTEPGGLQRRDAQQVDPSRVITDPYGRKWVAPDAKPAATPAQTFTDTNNLLKEGARPVEGGSVPVDQNTPRYTMDASGNLHDTGMFGANVPASSVEQGRLVTPPGTKQQFYVPPNAETEGIKQRVENGGKNPPAWDVDTEHFDQPVLINKSTGETRLIKLPDGVKHKDKAEKPDVQSIVPGMTGPHGGPLVFDKNTQTTKELQVPAGSKRELTPAQLEAKQRADERDQDRKDAAAQKRTDALTKQHDQLQKDEQAEWDNRARYGAIAEQIGKTTEGAGTFSDPRTGKEVTVTKDNRASLVKYYRYQADKAQQRALDKQGKARSIRQQLGGGEFAAGAGAGAGQPATQPAAQQNARTATMADVQAYATQHKVPLSAATKQFKKAGYQITGSGQ